MRREIDGKFYIDAKALRDPEIVSHTTGQAIPADEPLFLLRARDLHALATLHYYDAVCRQAGCTAEHLEGIERAKARFEAFRNQHTDRMKQPGSSWRQAKPKLRCAHCGKPITDAAKHVCDEVRHA